MKSRSKNAAANGLLFALALVTLLFSGCATTGAADGKAAQGSGPTVSGYISTSAVKKF